MKTTVLRLTQNQWAQICDSIRNARQVEQFGFLLARRAVSHLGEDIFLGQKMIFAERRDMEVQSAGYARPGRKLQGLAYQLAYNGNLSIIDFHTHTHSGQPHFSSIDDHHGQMNAAYVTEHFPAQCQMGMVVLNQDATAYEGRIYDPKARRFDTLHRVELLGSPISCMPAPDKLTASDQELFARHSLIAGWNQSRLATIRVGLAGCGGTGALMLQGLVGMGVGRHAGIIVCDPDRVEKSNLPRLPYAEGKDAGHFKVRVAKLFHYRRDRHVRIRPYCLGVQSFWAREALKTAHLLVGCVDSEAARSVLMELSLRYLIPYLDVATEIVPVGGGKYDAVGQVRVVLPGKTGCLFCCGGIDTQEVAAERMPHRWRRQRERAGYVRNTQVTPTPAVIHLNAVLTGLALSHLAKLIQGEDFSGHEHLYYSRNRDAIMAVACKPNPECSACGPGGILGAGDPIEENPGSGSTELMEVGPTECPEGGDSGKVTDMEVAQVSNHDSGTAKADDETHRMPFWSWLCGRRSRIHKLN